MSIRFSKDRELSDKVLQASELLETYVGKTFGPSGQTVILVDPRESDKAVITKDGVTVAKFLESDDPEINTALKVLKQSSIETVKRAGDGTTTAVILTDAVLKGCHKALSAGDVNVNRLKKELNDAMGHIELIIESNKHDIKNKQDIKSVALTSTNGDEDLSTVIAEVVDNVGRNGLIQIYPSSSNKTSIEYVEGYSINSGFWEPVFANLRDKNLASYNNPLVLVTDMVIEDIDEWNHFLALIDREGRPVIVFADDFRGGALASARFMAQKGLPVCLLKPPSHGIERKEILKDAAIMLGGEFISASKGDKLSEVKLTDLGSCRRFEASLNKATFFECLGSPEDVLGRINQLEAAIKQTHIDTERAKYQLRITSLSASTANILIGAMTEPEFYEKKHRLEDGLEAVRCAREGGLLPGGGVFLYLLSERLEGESEGEKILKKALKAPFEKLCRNAGESEVYYSKLIMELNVDRELKNIIGFDFSGPLPKEVVLMEAYIIDPKEVTLMALKNSVSAASTLMTVGGSIIKN